MIRSWVASETQRYARLCFHKHDFLEILTLFRARLKARGYPPHVINEGIDKVDYVSVQHDTLHFKVKLPDCAICIAQTATQPQHLCLNSSSSSTQAVYDTGSGLKRPKRFQEEVSTESRRYLTFMAKSPLADHRQELTRSLSRGLNKAENLAGLPLSTISVAWKTGKNLSTVLADSNRKSLLQR